MLAQSEVDREDLDESHTRALLISNVPPADSLRSSLERSGLDVHYSLPGPEALAAAVRAQADVVLVDGRSNEADAFQLCRALRAQTATPSALLIVITSEEREDLRVQAFAAGADDCFAEPGASRDLWGRLDTAKRRVRKDIPGHILRYADLELDLRGHKVRRSGTLIWLSSLQMRLLKFLMENPAVVFSRQELLQAVWDDKNLDEGTVTVGVVRLRRALNSTGRPNLIRQVRGFGYALDADFES